MSYSMLVSTVTTTWKSVGTVWGHGTFGTPSNSSQMSRIDDFVERRMRPSTERIVPAHHTVLHISDLF